MDASPDKTTGLLLSGGGARAAYQVGVLQAINQILQAPSKSPFQIVTGISAGAINGCSIASHSHEFSLGVRMLSKIWTQFTPDQIYKTDLSSLSKNALRWSWNLIRPKEQINRPLALLNNQPLRELLSRVINFQNIQKNIDKGFLEAVCTTAYNYNTGDSVNFYQGQANIQDWTRFRRISKADTLSVSHLLASSAIPMVFPSEPIDNTYYGDGAMRFLTPLSPALHLGARKLLVITVDPLRNNLDHKIDIPSIGDISGHLLDSIFIDSLESDIERLRRVNELLEHIPESDAVKSELSLKPIDALIISPTTDPAELAGQFFSQLPRGLKFFFKRMGIDQNNGESILSYLLFDSSFTQLLIKMGFDDAMQQQEDIKTFFLE